MTLDFRRHTLCLSVKTNKFRIAAGLYSNRSQKMSKCDKNISDICVLGHIMCAPFLFLPHFNIICDLLWNRNAATWNLFVNYRVDHILLREKK